MTAWGLLMRVLTPAVAGAATGSEQGRQSQHGARPASRDRSPHPAVHALALPPRLRRRSGPASQPRTVSLRELHHLEPDRVVDVA